MISSVTPVSSKPNTENDMPSWGLMALSTIGNLAMLIATIASEPGQSPSNEKTISGIVTQLNTLKSEIINGSISLDDFENQMNSIENQVENLPPPSGK